MTVSDKALAIRDGWVDYSPLVDGDRTNHHLGVRFDVSASGHLGISQQDHGRWADRVLLTPAQVKALKAFLREKRSWA